MKIILIPFYVLKFWYLEAPISILSYFVSLNKAFIGFFSVFLMIKTFFKPWKNEYRSGLIGFSRFMGMFFKTILLTVDFFMFIGLLILEAVIFVVFLAFPIAVFILPFVRF